MEAANVFLDVVSQGFDFKEKLEKAICTVLGSELTVIYDDNGIKPIAIKYKEPGLHKRINTESHRFVFNIELYNINNKNTVELISASFRVALSRAGYISPQEYNEGVTLKI